MNIDKIFEAFGKLVNTWPRQAKKGGQVVQGACKLCKTTKKAYPALEAADWFPRRYVREVRTNKLLEVQHGGKKMD